jgi:hypothetical protein
MASAGVREKTASIVHKTRCSLFRLESEILDISNFAATVMMLASSFSRV